jgi:tight adherence protein B
MPVGVIVAFVVVFALILLAVSVGLKFFDARRKQQVTGMLQTASGENVVTVTNLLKEIDIEKPGGLKGILKTFQFTKHAQEQIQQAGMSWSSTRLLAAMGLAMVPGLGLGALLPFLLNGPTTALVCALIFGAMPYLFVRHKRKKRLDALEEQFPEALDFLARSMRAGHAFSISLEMIGE